MNYAQARKLEDGSGWHFTVKNDDQIWPHECCRATRPATAADVARLNDTVPPLFPELKVGDLVVDQAHDPHASEEEAVACFNEWRRRQPVELSEEIFASWSECAICGAPTKGGATIRDIGGPNHISLCDDHRTEEHARSTITEISEACYS